ncbi:FIST signal transduction protein [Vibrio diazotrophicus]|uniref:FIST signal transduction protein n=1 Tax=Vibrio diazotrophicus TaxID=685 RepID=UPI00142D2A6F|nr:FIST N-terminal domain-containing protein [Vibrio diazotrophicus]NIY93291.1 histidine kinase [Vibrio diazotrophicus]
MRLETAISNNPDINDAIKEIKGSIKLAGISAIVCYYTEAYSNQNLSHYFSSHFSNIPLIGCSSCNGLMTDTGIHSGTVIGVMAIYDNSKSSAYGTAYASLKDCTKYEDVVRFAVYEALLKANRVGEVPDFILLHSTPGNEERIIEAIDSLFGTQVPIIGGTAADNNIVGNWSVSNEHYDSSDALTLLVGFLSIPVATSLSVGYSPTEHSGLVTEAVGRYIYAIDKKPAKQVYHQWLSEHSGLSNLDEYLFDYVSEFPIGNVVGQIDNHPYFKLSHPIRITDEDALEMFSESKVGETITLMTGSKEHLIERASRFVIDANTKHYNETEMIGGVIIFCAGSMLHLGKQMREVYEKITNQMNGCPFICPFTFGEQGKLVGGENAHGNLMISSAIFYESEHYL